MNCPICGNCLGGREYVLGIVNDWGQRVCTPNMLRLLDPEHEVEALIAHGLSAVAALWTELDILEWKKFDAMFRLVPRDMIRPSGMGQG